MKALKSFISQFTSRQLVDESMIKRIGDDYYVASKELASVLSRAKLQPVYVGRYLGRFAGKTSKPSLELLQLLARSDAKKVVVNEKGAWLFVCRRPVLKDSMVRCDAKPDETVVVLNEHGECLGYGLFDGKNVKNYYDIGDFLRRERRAGRK